MIEHINHTNECKNQNTKTSSINPKIRGKSIIILYQHTLKSPVKKSHFFMSRMKLSLAILFLMIFCIHSVCTQGRELFNISSIFNYKVSVKCIFIYLFYLDFYYKFSVLIPVGTDDFYYNYIFILTIQTELILLNNLHLWYVLSSDKKPV